MHVVALHERTECSEIRGARRIGGSRVVRTGLSVFLQI
jgi:hypothetical protein